MVKKLAVIALVLAVLLVFLASREWDSPKLGQAVLDRVGTMAGMEMKAEGFRLNLLRGIVLENVEAKSSSEGQNLTFHFDRLLLEHRLIPLLSGTVAVDRILLEKPRFELVQTDAQKGAPGKEEPKTPAEGESPEDGKAAVALEVKQIRIEDGSLSVKNAKGEEKTRVVGLDLEMENVGFDPNASSLAALSAEGTLSVEDIRFDALLLTETEGRFRLADAVFTVPELTFRMPHGEFAADAKLDFNPVPYRYELNAKGDPIDVNGMVGAKEGFGPANIQLTGSGAGPETKDLVADGQLQLAEGHFPETPMFSRIDQALGKRAVVGSPYKATQASFHLAGNRVTLAPFRFESGDARIALEGTMSLAGGIDFALSLATPREGLRVEGIGSEALDLLADDEGWVPVPIDMTGTMEDPTVRPDAKALAAQAAQGAKREIQEKATDALRDLLKKKKKE
ncbi:MAG: hypothetical protein ACRD21_02310 [Vicinamibacteria bacterium]